MTDVSKELHEALTVAHEKSTTLKSKGRRAMTDLTDIQQKRLQASNVCISIFTDVDLEDLDHAPRSIVRAWQIGKELCQIIAKEDNKDKDSE